MSSKIIKNLIKNVKSEASSILSKTLSNKDTNKDTSTSIKNEECKSNPTKPKLDLDEYDGQEMNRDQHDTTDKTKPFDNMESKLYYPGLREQFEKRKDIYHTLDTPYLKKQSENECGKEKESEKTNDIGEKKSNEKSDSI